jgi:hypothetical protein
VINYLQCVTKTLIILKSSQYDTTKIIYIKYIVTDQTLEITNEAWIARGENGMKEEEGKTEL